MRTQWMTVVLLAVATAALAGVREPVGLWNFDAADPNAAAVGQRLALTGTAQPAAGVTAGDGAVQIGTGSYFMQTNAIGANGGGTKVNEYSLLFDVKRPAISANKWMSLYQTNITNKDDADLWISKTSTIGVGVTDYTTRTIQAETWYRVIVTVDNGGFYRLYVNGELWLNGITQAVDGRFSLGDQLLLFADDNGVDSPIDVSTVALWGVPLAPGETLALGMAGASIFRDNAGPEVDAGVAQDAELPESGSVTVALDATVIDDGSYAVLWEKISGPNEIVFDDVTLEDATVTLGTPGRYVLRLTANDDEFGVSDTVTIAVHPANYDGLILHWDFEQSWNGRTFADVSGNNMHGALIDGTGGLSSYTTGKKGQGLNLNNGDFPTGGDYAAVDLVMPDSGSIALWYNPASLYQYHAVFDNSGNGDDWEMWIYDITGEVRFRVEDNAQASAKLNSLAPDGNCLGKWWHLVSTWQRTGNNVAVQLFVNGKLIESDPVGPWVNPGQQFFLSGGNPGNDHGNGIYDDVRIYNRPLSAEEVLALVYTGNKPPIVTVGADQTLWLDESGRTTAGLDGTVIDVDGSPLGKIDLLWEKIQGPNELAIADVKLEDTTATITAPGSYVFRLTANDGQFSDDDTLTVDVYPYGHTGLQVHIPLDGDPNCVAGATHSRLVDGADGGHAYIPGMLGQALRVTGSTAGATDNDFLAVDYTYSDNGTIAFWFRPDTIDYNYNSILDNNSHQDDWEMWVYGTGELSARLQAGYLRDFWVRSGTWYHIAMTWKRSSVNPALVDEQLFVDGRLIAENLANEWVNPGSQLYLGGGHPSQTDCNGAFDDLRIYDRPLVSREIETLASRSDFNGDHRVDLTDFATLAGAWLSAATPCQSAPQGDYNVDCRIDGADLARFAHYWLTLP